MFTHRCLLLAVTFVTVSLLVSVEHAVAQFKAGAASVAITPEQPLWMGGYASRKAPSAGKVHDLYAKALALEDADGNRFVIVTTDLLGITPRMRSIIEAGVAANHDMKAHQLLINASHTHCGPELRDNYIVRRGGTAEFAAKARQYVDHTCGKIVDVVGQAVASMQPVTLDYTFARAGFAMNRRLPMNGGLRNSPNPRGPVDHEVPVLRVTNQDGQLIAILFSYACHNTTLSFQKFSGDYAGFAQEYLEAAHPKTVALFMAGCGGDQNPYPRRTLGLAQQHGRALANAVETALDVIDPQRIEGPIHSALDTVSLQFAGPPSKAELEQRLKKQSGRAALHTQRLLAQLKQHGKIASEYGFPLQVLQLGDDLTLVALSGEAVVDYSLRLKRELPRGANATSSTWIVGYSNYVFGYLPSRRVLEEGGYEGGAAMISTDFPGPFAPTVEERVVGKVKQMVDNLRAQR